MRLYFTRPYERAIRKLLSEDVRREMEAAIVAAPDAAPVVRGYGRHPQVALGWLRPGKAGRHSRALLLVPGPRSRLHADGLREGGPRRSDRGGQKGTGARLVAEIERERQRE